MAYKITGTTIIDDSRNIIQSTFKNYTETTNALGTLTDGSTNNIDLANGNVITATLPTSGSVTFTFTTGVSSGAVSFTLYLINGASGTPTINWPASVKWTGATTPTRTTTASRVSVWSFITIDNGTTWYGALGEDNLATAVSLAASYFSSTIDAVYLSAGGTGTYFGETSGTTLSAYRHGGFTGSKIFEWRIGSGFSSPNSDGWTSGLGFAGICDATHWNAGPGYGTSSGERAAFYFGTDFSYGDSTGTSISNYNASYNAWNVNDIFGVAYNDSNGKLNVYKNGNLSATFTNSGFIGQTLYPIVQEWVGDFLSSTMLTVPSTYAYSYTLPT